MGVLDDDALSVSDVTKVNDDDDDEDDTKDEEEAELNDLEDDEEENEDDTEDDEEAEEDDTTDDEDAEDDYGTESTLNVKQSGKGTAGKNVEEDEDAEILRENAALLKELEGDDAKKKANGKAGHGSSKDVKDEETEDTVVKKKGTAVKTEDTVVKKKGPAVKKSK